MLGSIAGIAINLTTREILEIDYWDKFMNLLK